ncbi:MAG: twin-arginine translocase TatA/TatE family subunit [Planctomycetes bacterium]|nr:twin-arginine translocase TatA/TatE family subunit [Planctomycetota bacterium]
MVGPRSPHARSSPHANAMTPIAFAGPTELWIVLAIVVVIFGARKLPELARAMGSSITQFKHGLKEEPGQLEEGADGDADEGDTNKEEG